VAIGSPLAAEIPNPYPMSAYLANNIIAAISSFFLIEIIKI
jgi:hypothetical protein